MSERTERLSWLERHITLHTHDTVREERANAATHAVGALLSPVALVLLLTRYEPDWPHLIFGLSMMLLYTASTLYHLSTGGKWKRIFRIGDHMSIYLLIAGTYTPIMASLATPWARRTLLAVWVLGFAGMAFKLVFWGRFKVLQVLFYLAMGWLAAIRLPELLELLPLGLFYSMLTGGLLYTLGTVVYAMKRLPYYHAIWHCFVLGGSGAFFYGIYRYL